MNPKKFRTSILVSDSIEIRVFIKCKVISCDGITIIWRKTQITSGSVEITLLLGLL